MFRPLRIDLLLSFASFGISWSDPCVEYVRIMTPGFSPPRIIDMQSMIHNCGKPQFLKKFFANARISIGKITLKNS
jgi:hypothetical protein